MTELNIAVVLVADRSGSMDRIATATQDALEEFVNKQKAQPGGFTVDTVFYDDQYEERAVMVDPRVTDLDLAIHPRGMTAMYDAIGRKINSFAANLEKLEEKPDKILFVIATDGLENASKEYTQKSVAALIKSKQDEGWDFTFIGANQDAVLTARGLNIAEKDSITCAADEKGAKSGIDAMSGYTTNIRLGKVAEYSAKDREEAISADDDKDPVVSSYLANAPARESVAKALANPRTTKIVSRSSQKP
jgi:hypothetical protein